MLNTDEAMVFVIDMQERLVGATGAKKEVDIAAKIVKGAKILGVPVLFCEQYAQKLGSTVDVIKQELDRNALAIHKTAFSIFRENAAQESIESLGKKQVILFGIETHVCVYQSAIDFIQRGYEVYLVEEACKSRKEKDHKTGVELMRQFGVKITCVETVLFELLGDSKSLHFKAVQALIK